MADQVHIRPEDYGGLLVDAVTAIVVALDREGRIIFFNRGAEKLTGYRSEQVLGQPWFGVLVPSERYPDVERSFHQAVARGRPSEYYENPMVTSSGEERIILWRNTPLSRDGQLVGTLSFGLDITELRQAESQARLQQAKMAQAERMATVGVLAAGVAHEINNPLTYLRLNLDMLDRLAQGDASSLDGEEIRRYLADAREAAERVTRIVRDLHSFARPQSDERGPVDMSRVAHSALRLVSNELRHRAEVVIECEGVPPVVAEEGRMVQVALNLVQNALQALPESPGTGSWVRVAVEACDQDVCLTVADNGCGMAPEVAQRAFEPFYTTKSPGQGTGLGLAIAHGIVTSLGGTITVDSEPGHGTRMRVRLPASTTAGVAAPCRPRKVQTLGGMRILVIDDEALIGAAVIEALTPRHQVDFAICADQAIEAALSETPYDLILCDLMMPDRNGIDIYQHITSCAPELADTFVFMTGGAFTESTRTFLAAHGGATLEKPFEISTLEQLLDRYSAQRAPAATSAKNAR